tara:strand:+ start:1520 stop:2746 length:1227 start_codon:yes stop_codon:yes gene_type:complete
MNKFLQEFHDRGYFYQCTDNDGLSDVLNNKKIRAYIGFDCTAESLHVGSLLQIMCLRLLQKHGHQPIVLLGGGTTRIGDPSGKDKTRQMLEEKAIEKNIKNIEKILKIFLISDNEDTSPIFVNNYNWLKDLNYISFLRDIGKHFTINKMLSFDSVKLRLDREQSLSYMEFNYMILQAYDFLELNKKHNCLLQIGGSDQWGNIVNGVELIKRYSSNETFGLTTPLITLASGTKMGKTESGAIWLDKDLLSPYDYWQFWRNIDDKDLTKFLKIFTDISIEELEKRKNEDVNELKVLLANHATALLHGEKESKKCFEQAKKIFYDNSSDEGLPTFEVKKNQFKNKNLSDLILSTKLETSKSEIKRIIKNNGIKIDNLKIENDLPVSEINLESKNFFKLSIGKKKHFKIVIS